MITIKELMKKIKTIDYDLSLLNEEEQELFDRFGTLKQRKGMIAEHFKGKLYLIIGTAMHSETGEHLVVYKALYGNGDIYVRPTEMFLSRVDKEKYPDVKVEYRMNFIEGVKSTT